MVTRFLSCSVLLIAAACARTPLDTPVLGGPFPGEDAGPRRDTGTPPPPPPGACRVVDQRELIVWPDAISFPAIATRGGDVLVVFTASQGRRSMLWSFLVSATADLLSMPSPVVDGRGGTLADIDFAGAGYALAFLTPDGSVGVASLGVGGAVVDVGDSLGPSDQPRPALAIADTALALAWEVSGAGITEAILADLAGGMGGMDAVLVDLDGSRPAAAPSATGGLQIARTLGERASVDTFDVRGRVLSSSGHVDDGWRIHQLIPTSGPAGPFAMTQERLSDSRSRVSLVVGGERANFSQSTSAPVEIAARWDERSGRVWSIASFTSGRRGHVVVHAFDGDDRFDATVASELPLDSGPVHVALAGIETPDASTFAVWSTGDASGQGHLWSARLACR